MASDPQHPAEANRPIDLRFVDRTAPTAAETAAVIAVVSAALEQREPAPLDAPGGDEWVRSGRALRQPVQPGPGRWRRAL